MSIETVMNAALHGLLSLLDQSERDAITGDLIEAQDSAMQSVVQVLGLLIRRQVFAWRAWRPWLVLLLAAIPLAFLLSVTTQHFARSLAVLSWMLINNADAALLKSSGYWSGAMETCWATGRFALVLIGCSWMCGRLLASISRKTAFSMWVLFSATIVVICLVGVPSHAKGLLLQNRQRDFPNAPVFQNVFYRHWFPLIVCAMAIMLPSFAGMTLRLSRMYMRPAWNVVYGCSAALVVSGLMMQPWLLLELWSWQVVPIRYVHLPNLLPVVSIAPACLLLLELFRASVLRGVSREQRSARSTSSPH